MAVTGAEALAAAKILGELIKLVPKGPDLSADLRELSNGLLAAQTHALSAQHQTALLLEQNDALKKECAELKDFSAKAQEYEPREAAHGLFVHVRKDETQPPANAMKFCSNCFLDRQLTLLQLQRKPPYKILICQRGHDALTFMSWLGEV